MFPSNRSRAPLEARVSQPHLSYQHTFPRHYSNTETHQGFASPYLPSSRLHSDDPATILNLKILFACFDRWPRAPRTHPLQLFFARSLSGDAPAVPSRLREREVRADPIAGSSEQGARALSRLVSSARDAAQDVSPCGAHGPDG